MVDKIDGNNGIQPRRNDTFAAKAPESGGNSRSPVSDIAATHPFDSREMGTTSTYEQLRQRVQDGGDIDQQKVNDIKQALQRGDFAIDANRVATAVVELEQLLVG